METPWAVTLLCIVAVIQAAIFYGIYEDHVQTTEKIRNAKIQEFHEFQEEHPLCPHNKYDAYWEHRLEIKQEYYHHCLGI